MNADTEAVATASEVVSKAHSDLDAVADIYHYVIENVVYDEEKAATVTSGYLPDVDETLATGKGICFDYAALTTAMLRSQDIPTRLEGTGTRNHNFYIYLTHRYRLGFYREVTKLEDTQDPAAQRRAQQDSTALPKDTIVEEEFVPVTSFIHTFKVERSRRTFRSSTEPTGEDAFYENTYLQEGASNDSTIALSVKNVFGISLLEGFHKYAKAGLTAYVSHNFNRYTLMNMDTSLPRPTPLEYTEHEFYVGGELSKRQGSLLHYNVTGEVGLAGKAAGQFKVNGDIDLNFRLGKDTVNFYARGHVRNRLPSFYMRHDHSNHFAWDNDNMS